MVRSRTSNATGTKVGDRGNTALSQDSVRLLKTQDIGYLRTMAMKARKDTEKLQARYLVGKEAAKLDERELHADERGNDEGLRHLVFVDTKEEQKDYERPRQLTDRTTAEEDEVRTLGKRRANERETHKRRLEAAKARQKDIEAAERELDLQRARMSKSPSVGGTNKRGVTWKVRQRKK